MSTDENQQQDVNFLNEFSNFIFTSKYARYNEKLDRRETWEECISRVEKMHLDKFKTKITPEDLAEIKWAFEKVKDKKVVPSMRSMQFGGKAVLAHNPRIFNCSVRHIDSIRSFAESFYLLLCGTGVGFGLSKHFINRLPNLVSKKDKTGTVVTYVVQDDIEGWADSIEALLNCYFKNTAYTGRKIIFDYSRIRPEGAPLKTGGGKAPGYRGLKQTHIKIKNLLDHIIEDLHQTKLHPINAYDILMHIADAVLSGGIRRSACSVIFDKDDEEMMNAKTFFNVSRHTKFTFDEDTQKWYGKITVDKKKYEVELYDYDYQQVVKDKKISWFYIEPQRARSNNSVLFLRDEVTIDEFKNIIEKTRQFGEPGFVFGDHKWQLFNPCQPAWAKLITKDGIKEFKDVKIGDYIWSKEGWTKVLNKWSNGIKKVNAYRTSAGTFYGTENHKIVSNNEKIEAKDAESIDIFNGEYVSDITLDPQTIMDGLVFGDGTVHKASNNLVLLCIGDKDQDYFQSEIKDLIIKERKGVGPYVHEIETTIKDDELKKTYERIIPDRFFYADRNTIASFLRGLYTANGSICGSRVTLKSTSFKLIEQVQTMLSYLGIKSYYTTNKPSQVKFKNGEYLCKESYDLNISTDREKFQKIIGFIQQYKNEKLSAIIEKTNSNGRKNNYDIISVDFVSEEEVFDITVDNESHTYWTQGCNVSNCFEINFIPVTEDGVCGVQFCNLSSINGAKIATKEDFFEAVKAATIIGTLQASYTDFTYLSNAAKQLTDEEALLGVSITGMMDNPDVLLNAKVQKEGAKIAKETNEKWAKTIGINPAARITCIKPEGTSSAVLGSASGIHPHHSHRYFRRVQCNKIDPVYKFFKKQNKHMTEESVWSANKTDDVIAFPLTISDKAMVKKDLSAIQHLDYIKSTQINWVNQGATEHNKKKLNHNVSCTVLVNEDEWNKVIEYLYENRRYFCAVSLLPTGGDKIYQQAPLETITTEEDENKWKNYVGKYTPVDYTQLHEGKDNTELSKEAACAGGSCEIRFVK